MKTGYNYFTICIALLTLSLFSVGFVNEANAQITVFPHVETFDTFPNVCGVDCGDPCVLVGGWENQSNADIAWTINSGSTVSSSTGPGGDHTSGAGIYLYTESSSPCYNSTAAAISPPLDLTGLTNFRADFWYHMYGSSMGTLTVDVSTNNGVTWTDNVITPFTDDLDQWQMQTVVLDTFVGNTILLRFRGTTGTSFYSDMAIDDVRFYSLAADDAGIVSIDAPTLPMTAGLNDVRATISSFGTDTLTSATIGWSVNGMVQTPYNWTGSLLFGETDPAVNIGSFNFPAGTSTIKVWSEMPNGTADGDFVNDTAEITVCTGLSGNYIIGPGGDYTTFSAAALDMATCGIVGPVVFDVDTASGVFNEQVTFANINGLSATNTVTINGNADTLAFESASSAKYILQLDGVKHFTIDNLVIQGTDPTYGIGILLMNNADSNTIKNCVVDVSSVTSTSSTNSAGIAASESITSPSSQGPNANYLTLENNTVIGGYYGIRINGDGTSRIVNNVVNGNTVQDFYAYGIYMNDNDGAVVSNNDVSRPTRTSVTTFYGIYFTGAINSVATTNRIHNTHDMASSLTGSSYGLYFSSSDAPVGFENIAYNNLLYNFNSDGTVYAIYNSSSDGAYYYHNTISLDNTAATGGTTRGFYQTLTADNIEIKNNIFSITRGGTGTKHCLYFNSSTSTITSDNNVLFTDTSMNSIGRWSGTDYNNIADWRLANDSTFDINSVVEDPLFVNVLTDDLAPTSGEINNIGDTVNIATDFFGNARNINSPDPGAIEFDPPTLDASIMWVGPVTPTTAGNQTVTVNVENSVSSIPSLTSASITYTDGLTPITQSFTGLSIAPGTNQDLNFTTPYNIGSLDTLTAYFNSVNGVLDAIQSNDTTLPVVLCAALIDTFTIDAGSSTAGTNFNSFNDAAFALANCGVAGPVVFNVVPGSGPYMEQVEFITVSGLSATNTITFNGNGDTLMADPSSTDRHVLRLNGAKHMTFNDLNIIGINSTYGWGVHLYNGADSNSLVNCTIDVSAVGSTSSSNSIGIVATNSTTSVTSGSNNANFLTLSGNTVIGGYYGIRLNGSSADKAMNNMVMGNTVRDFYIYGIYLDDNNGTMVMDNDVSRPNRVGVSTFYGIYLTGGNLNVTVQRNRVHNTHDSASSLTGSAYAIYLSSCDAPNGEENKIINNLIYNFNSNGTVYALYNSGSDGVYYYHNTISLDDTSATGGSTRGFYQTTTADNIQFKNNIISITRGGSGTKYCLYFSSTASTIESDNNVLYMAAAAGTNNIGYYSGSQNTFTDWQAANGGAYDQASSDQDPGFTDPANLNFVPSNSDINNIGADVGVAEDFNLSARNVASPDPGAFIFNPAGLDAAVSWVSPVPPLSAGNQIITVAISNTRTTTITDLVLSYTDGVFSSPFESFNGLSIAGGGSQNISFAIPYNLMGYANITVNIDSVNGTMDDDLANDTITQGICSFLSGTYFIDAGSPASNTSFPSFTEAIEALSYCGIDGPVTLEVVQGTGPYNEQITIAQFPGLSSTNTLTINGNGETLQFTPVTSARHIVLLDGAKHVTIDNLNIVGQSSTYGYGVHFQNQADSNTISNCVVDISAVTSSTSTNSTAILASGSSTSTSTNDDNGSYNTIINNDVIGGYYCIRWNGASSTKAMMNVISGNTVRDFYTYGIYLDDTEGTLVSNNDVTRANRSSVSTFYGIYLTSGNQSTLVERNKLHNTHDMASSLTGAVYTIYFSSCDAAVGMENVVINNAIYNINSNGTIYAIYNSGSDGAYYYHNTISLDFAGSTGGTTRGFYQTSTADNVKFKNNLISVQRGGSGTKHGIYLNSTSSTVEADYNAYFIDTTLSTDYVGRYSSTDYNSLPAWQTANSNAYDQNSVFADPIFSNPAGGDLRPSNVSLDNTGDSLGIFTDINLVNRDTTNPDVGAFEFTVSPIDASVVTLIDPVDGICGSDAIEIKVVVRNVGLNTLNSIPITTVLGGATSGIILDTIMTPLANSAYDTISVGTFDFTAGGVVSFTIYTSVPGDGDPINDTITTGVDIEFAPQAPMATVLNDSICKTDSTLLVTMPQANTVKTWYDEQTGGNILGVGDTLATGSLDSTSTFYVESQGETVASVGKPAPTDSDGFITDDWGMVFDALSDVTIDSFHIYPEAAGIVSITTTTSSGTPVTDTVTAIFTAADINQATPVYVGWDIPMGTDYYVIVTAYSISGLRRDFGGNNYPYTLPGKISITGSLQTSPTTGVYYWFYDWKVRVLGCPSERTPVTVTVDSILPVTPTFTYTTAGNGLDVNFAPDDTRADNSYNWDFGDGSGINIGSIAHTYAEDGTYDVCLAVTNRCSSDTSCQSINVCSDLINDVTTVRSVDGLTVELLFNGVGTPDSLLWAFSDSSFSSDESPTKVFANDTSFSVVLYTENVCGDKDTSTHTFSVCTFLNPNFSSTISTNGLLVDFTSVIDGTPTSYLWDFGDGDTDTVPNTQHVYANNGNYQVSLIVDNACGDLDTITKTVNACGNLNAAFGIADDGLDITLTNMSQGSGLTYNWNFGDSNTGTVVNPTYSYTAAGTYDITLVATDICGKSDTTTQTVSVAVGIFDPLTGGTTINVYPNPSNGQFTIEYALVSNAKVKLRIYNTLGKESFSHSFDGTIGNHKLGIDLSDMPKGLYFLELRTGSEAYNKKITLE